MDLLFLIFASCFGQDMEKSFQVVFEGRIKDKSFLKVQSEYQTSKDITFCRGHFVPFAIGKWKCRQEDKKVKCSKNYKCKVASKKLNRRTLSLAAKRKLEKAKKAEPGFHIGLRLLKKDKKVKVKTVKKDGIKKTVSFLEKIEEHGVKEEKLQKRPQGEIIHKQRNGEYDGEAYQLVPSPGQVRQAKGKETKVKGHRTDLSYEKVREVEDIETDWVAKRRNSPDGVPVYEEVVKRESIRDETHRPITHGKLKSFVISAMKVSNDSGSFYTLDGAWSPYFQFNAQYALRANLGTHFIRVTSLYRDLSFLVFSLELQAIYFFANRFFVELGGGRQYWQNDERDTHNIFTLGGGYKFRKHLFLAVDRIFASVGLVQNKEDNLELKLGMGLSF